MDGSKVLNGTYGQIWVDDELLAEVTSFQAKVDIIKEDVKFCGQMQTDYKVMATKGKGTIKLLKMYTRFWDYLEKISQGVDVRFTVISKLADPSGYGTERVKVEGCSFDDFTLADWEAQKLIEEEHPFTFVKFEKVDSINA